MKTRMPRDCDSYPQAREEVGVKTYAGFDLGTESLKVVVMGRSADGTWLTPSFSSTTHAKDPHAGLERLLDGIDWSSLAGAAVTGSYARLLDLPRIPAKQARATGFRHRFDADPVTLVAIGSHGFSVLELRDGGADSYRENSRCSQGTGNFLRQLVGRFDLDVEAASELCVDVTDPAPLSGRCPVILKTDMTHLANQGQSRASTMPSARTCGHWSTRATARHACC